MSWFFLNLTESDESHEEDLQAASQEHWEQHTLPGRTENISVDELPAELLLRILLWKYRDEAYRLIHRKIKHSSACQAWYGQLYALLWGRISGRVQAQEFRLFFSVFAGADFSNPATADGGYNHKFKSPGLVQARKKLMAWINPRKFKGSYRHRSLAKFAGSALALTHTGQKNILGLYE